MGRSYAVMAPAALAAQDESSVLTIIDARSAAVQIAGTFVGTLTFQATVDGTNYIAVGLTPVAGGAVATTAAAAGIWTLPVNPGYSKLRVYWTARTSGSLTVTAIAGD